MSFQPRLEVRSNRCRASRGLPARSGRDRRRLRFVSPAYAVEYREEMLVALIDVIAQEMPEVAPLLPEHRAVALVDRERLRADGCFHIGDPVERRVRAIADIRRVPIA